MHGPSSSLVHPFADLPYIRLVDSVVTTLFGAQRRQWKRRRNFALRQWSAAGLLFLVEKGVDTPQYDPSMAYVDDGEHMLIPGAIHLVPGSVDFENSNVPGTGWLFPVGGFAFWNMARFWGWSATYQKYIVTHEIGHALGLGHAKASAGGKPTSVMYEVGNTSRRPDAHDLDSLRTFYF